MHCKHLLHPVIFAQCYTCMKCMFNKGLASGEQTHTHTPNVHPGIHNVKPFTLLKCLLYKSAFKHTAGPSQLLTQTLFCFCMTEGRKCGDKTALQWPAPLQKQQLSVLATLDWINLSMQPSFWALAYKPSRVQTKQQLQSCLLWRLWPSLASKCALTGGKGHVWLFGSVFRGQKIRPLLISAGSGNNCRTGESSKEKIWDFFTMCSNVDPCFGWVKHVTITRRAGLQLNPQGSFKCQGYICLWHAQIARCNVWNEHVDAAKSLMSPEISARWRFIGPKDLLSEFQEVWYESFNTKQNRDIFKSPERQKIENKLGQSGVTFLLFVSFPWEKKSKNGSSNVLISLFLPSLQTNNSGLEHLPQKKKSPWWTPPLNPVQ